jgi:hypothetical protein
MNYACTPMALQFSQLCTVGAGHGWLGLNKDETQFVDWFDKHLKKAS